MSAFENLTAAKTTAAREVRIKKITDEEIFQRAREAFIFAHPAAPNFMKRLARTGRLDWLLASVRQAMMDIEKPVDFLTHEARAAWVLNTHAGVMQGMTKEQREAMAQVAFTAIRVGTKGLASPPHAVIKGIGWSAAIGFGAIAATVTALVACLAF